MENPQYKHYLNMVLGLLGVPGTIISHDTKIKDVGTFIRNKKIEKLEQDFHIKIQLESKIVDIVEEMYYYRPF